MKQSSATRSTRKQVLLSERIERYKLFTFACLVYPAFAVKTRAAMTGKPYSWNQAKAILSLCHLKIVDAVHKGLPGTEDLQGLGEEYLSSPRALTLAIENDGLREGMKRGSISLSAAIEISRLDI